MQFYLLCLWNVAILNLWCSTWLRTKGYNVNRNFTLKEIILSYIHRSLLSDFSWKKSKVNEPFTRIYDRCFFLPCYNWVNTHSRLYQSILHIHARPVSGRDIISPCQLRLGQCRNVHRFRMNVPKVLDSCQETINDDIYYYVEFYDTQIKFKKMLNYYYFFLRFLNYRMKSRLMLHGSYAEERNSVFSVVNRRIRVVRVMSVV